MPPEDVGSATPDAAAGTDTSVAEAAGGEDFSNLGNDFDELTAGLDAPELAARPEPKQAPGDKTAGEVVKAAGDAEQKPSATTPDAKPPGEAKPAAEAKDATKEAQPAKPPGEAPGSEIDAALADLTKNEAQYVEHLAQTSFKLSPEMVEALTNGDGVSQIPKIVATAYVRAVNASVAAIQKLVPAMIERETQRLDSVRTQREADEKDFFGKFPALDKAKHWKDVQQMAHSLYQLNPSISRDDLIAMTGAAVMARHGITAQSAAKQIPAVPTGTGFVPGNGGRPVSRQPAADSNPFAGMSQDYDEG